MQSGKDEGDSLRFEDYMVAAVTILVMLYLFGYF